MWRQCTGCGFTAIDNLQKTIKFKTFAIRYTAIIKQNTHKKYDFFKYCLWKSIRNIPVIANIKSELPFFLEFSLKTVFVYFCIITNMCKCSVVVWWWDGNFQCIRCWYIYSIYIPYVSHLIMDVFLCHSSKRAVKGGIFGVCTQLVANFYVWTPTRIVSL